MDSNDPRQPLVHLAAVKVSSMVADSGSCGASLLAVADILGHRFAAPDLLETALTHPSVEGRENYQRLEFLGDRVLGLVVARWLYETFPSEPEGKLNRRFTALVRRETLAEVAQTTGLAEHIRMGAEGAVVSGANPPTTAVLADVCESVIGALYLDAGIEAADRFIRAHWSERLRSGPTAFRDSKTALQEWAQGRGLPLPAYRILGRSGPDHDPVFRVAVALPGIGDAEGEAATKRAAEQKAAAAMLDLVADSPS